jgi:hypothetical protein
VATASGTSSNVATTPSNSGSSSQVGNLAGTSHSIQPSPSTAAVDSKASASATSSVAAAPAATLTSISQSQISPSSQTATNGSAVSNVSTQAAAQSSLNTGPNASVQPTTIAPSKAGMCLTSCLDLKNYTHSINVLIPYTSQYSIF